MPPDNGDVGSSWATALAAVIRSPEMLSTEYFMNVGNMDDEKALSKPTPLTGGQTLVK